MSKNTPKIDNSHHNHLSKELSDHPLAYIAYIYLRTNSNLEFYY